MRLISRSAFGQTWTYFPCFQVLELAQELSAALQAAGRVEVKCLWILWSSKSYALQLQERSKLKMWAPGNEGGGLKIYVNTARRWRFCAPVSKHLCSAKP